MGPWLDAPPDSTPPSPPDLIHHVSDERPNPARLPQLGQRQQPHIARRPLDHRPHLHQPLIRRALPHRQEVRPPAELLAETSLPDTKTDREACIRAAAERLGNTPAICRRHYLHPGIITRWEVEALPDPPAMPIGLSRSQRRTLAAHRDALLAGNQTETIFTRIADDALGAIAPAA